MSGTMYYNIDDFIEDQRRRYREAIEVEDLRYYSLNKCCGDFPHVNVENGVYRAWCSNCGNSESHTETVLLMLNWNHLVRTGKERKNKDEI